MTIDFQEIISFNVSHSHYQNTSRYDHILDFKVAGKNTNLHLQKDSRRGAGVILSNRRL